MSFVRTLPVRACRHYAEGHVAPSGLKRWISEGNKRRSVERVSRRPVVFRSHLRAISGRIQNSL